MTAGLIRNHKATRVWHNIFKHWKEKNLSAHNSIFTENKNGEIKIFSDKGKLGELVASRSTLNEWLRNLQTERKWAKEGSLKWGSKKEQRQEEKYGVNVLDFLLISGSLHFLS
jgi:hypothetical protein